MRIIGLLLSFLLCTSLCSAQGLPIEAEINQLKVRLEALEHKVTAQSKIMEEQKQYIADQNKKISEYETKISQFSPTETKNPVEQLAQGLDMGAGITTIIQGANNTNNATTDISKNEDRTDASYSADITIGKEFKEVNGEAFLHLEAGQGAGLEDDLTLYRNVNRDADNDNNVRVTEAWYKQKLFNEKLSLTFGKLDATILFDTNEIANDETTKFLSRMFRNSPAIEFPDNTIGLHTVVMPVSWLELSHGVFDGNNDWEKIDDNLFNIGQITFKTNFFDKPGNYRFLGWYSNVYHTDWSVPEKDKESAYGFGLSFDQKVTDIITLFTRYGWQDPEVYNPNILATGDLNYSLKQSWSTGLEIEGKPWGREKDSLGFAYGEIMPSPDYKKAGESLDPVRLAKTEKHLEAYYRIHINDHLAISPDFQYIINPFGDDVSNDTENIFVGGVRVQVGF